MEKVLTILDFCQGHVYSYELIGSEWKIDGEELVRRYGHDVDNCQYMVHDMDRMSMKYQELPF